MGANGTDYQSDCLIHGLYNLPNIELINSPIALLMYKETFGEGKKNLSSVYGRGFTIYGTLPKYNHYEKEDVIDKINNRYFDYVIFSHCYMEGIYHKEVLKKYDKKQIILIDGKDDTLIRNNYVDKAIYFKRELIKEHKNKKVIPISFAFPEEKIQTSLPKIRKDSLVKPTFQNSKKVSTYKYEIEQEYYNDYRQSLFGLTTKKAGWDCMRHYEIMACRCIPYWRDMEQCPKTIAQTIPKHIIRESNVWYGHSWEYYQTEQGNKEYHDLENKIFEHFKEHCTTKALAQYVLDIMKSL